MSSPYEFDQFFADLGRRRTRLLELATPADTSTDDLMSELQELGQQLVVAEEELRVQQDELDDARARLEVLAADRDDLLNSSVVPYVITDESGVVLETNRATDQLVRRPPRRIVTPPIATWFEVANRGRVRSVIGRVRKGVESETLENIAVRRSDGTTVPMDVTVSKTAQPRTGRTVLRWELRYRQPTRLPSLRSVSDEQEEIRRELTAELGLLTQQLEQHRALPEVASALVNAALRLICGADGAGVALVKRGGKIETAASSDEFVSACDEAQVALAGGPAIDALNSQTLVVLDDLAGNARYAEFAARAAALGLRTLMCAPLSATTVKASLTVYSGQPNAFDERARFTMSMLAVHGAVALGRAGTEENLRLAVETRQLIGQAVGILIERHRVTATAAFDLLVRASQNKHIKLRELAALVVETGQDPRNIRAV